MAASKESQRGTYFFGGCEAGEAGDAAGEQVPEEDAVDGDVVDAEFEEVREDDKR